MHCITQENTTYKKATILSTMGNIYAEWKYTMSREVVTSESVEAVSPAVRIPLGSDADCL